MVAIPLRFTFSSSLPPLLPPPLPPPFLSISSAFSDRSLVPIYTTGCRIFWIVNFRETYIESFWLIIGSHLVATSFISHPSSAPHPYLPHYSTLSPPPLQTSSFWPLKIITVFAPRLSACQSGFAAHQPGKSHDEELLWNSRWVIHRRKSDPSCVKTLISRRFAKCARNSLLLCNARRDVNKMRRKPALNFITLLEAITLQCKFP